MEVKAGPNWRREFGGPRSHSSRMAFLDSGVGVYTGAVELKDGPVRVLPVGRFLEELAAGRVLR